MDKIEREKGDVMDELKVSRTVIQLPARSNIIFLLIELQLIA